MSLLLLELRPFAQEKEMAEPSSPTNSLNDVLLQQEIEINMNFTSAAENDADNVSQTSNNGDDLNSLQQESDMHVMLVGEADNQADAEGNAGRRIAMAQVDVQTRDEVCSWRR